MNSQFQKNQEMFQQQQRMKQMAYYQQQMQQQPPISQSFKPKSNDEFARVEQETLRLINALSAGKISQESFDQALKKLMIKDHQERWWMLGTESNTWYRYDGVKWLKDTPPGRQSPQALNYTASQRATRTDSMVTTSGFWFKFILLSTIWSALGFAVAEVVGGFRLLVPNMLNNFVPGALIGLALGICQLIVMRRYTRQNFYFLLGYLLMGFVIGMSSPNFLGGFLMGLVNAIAGFFILKKDYKNSGFYLILRPLILGFAWMLASILTMSIGAIPFGNNPMLQVAGYGLARGAAAGLIDGILLGLILKLILRKPKDV